MGPRGEDSWLSSSSSIFGTKHTGTAEAGEVAVKDSVTDLADTELGVGVCILCLLNAVSLTPAHAQCYVAFVINREIT